MSWLDPFTFPFLQNAFLIGALVAVPTAILSCFLVLKGWALMGDAVSHAVLPGVVISWLAGIPLVIGAFGAGMVCAVATGFIADNSRVKRDTVMGVIYATMFAIGVILYTTFPSDQHLSHILFGNMLGVGPEDLWLTGGIAVMVTLVLLVKWRDFLLHAFDPVQAQASGLRTGWLHYGLLAILSLTVVATLSSVGMILAIALLITPGATAFLLTRRFGAMMAVSVAICLTAMLGGTYLSVFLDSAPAPTVVLILTAIFLAAFIRRMRQVSGSSGVLE
ncbi:metal ABC transporter permease [Falsirhodobacter halotolerans]|uniref:metal ABC transporter permease n=1 Tax=Falsirhodobacter halotolerans TaxID=1146892 RepID=UPI001FD15F39|nr:metal ABC transporter permease [Falsirhodobacter halotolerans]MCJ8140408.1 metal ABC transporter permease [Falsirhodobacter halotolerans]